jgi:hypothetical protein
MNMETYLSGRICCFGYVAWQRCEAYPDTYVVFMVKPAFGPKPYLAVVDDFGSLRRVER